MGIATAGNFAHEFLVWAGRKARRKKTGQDAVNKELTLLVEAYLVERKARTLLADAGEVLALYDAHTPFDTKQIGCGKGLLAVRMALNNASRAQRDLKWGDDFIGASIRMNIAKAALASAEEKAKLGKVMASEKIGCQSAARLGAPSP